MAITPAATSRSQSRASLSSPRRCQIAYAGGNHQWPDRGHDSGRANGRAALRHLHQFLQDQTGRPRRQPETYPQRAHRGDTYVWLKGPNVLSTGDTFTNGRYPNIDFANGGNIDGMIAAADAYLKLTNARTKIVPGHGPLADKPALLAYRNMLVTARDRMEPLVKQRK